jgi:hypothetical protein
MVHLRRLTPQEQRQLYGKYDIQTKLKLLKTINALQKKIQTYKPKGTDVRLGNDVVKCFYLKYPMFENEEDAINAILQIYSIKGKTNEEEARNAIKQFLIENPPPPVELELIIPQGFFQEQQQGGGGGGGSVTSGASGGGGGGKRSNNVRTPQQQGGGGRGGGGKRSNNVRDSHQPPMLGMLFVGLSVIAIALTIGFQQ